MRADVCTNVHAFGCVSHCVIYTPVYLKRSPRFSNRIVIIWQYALIEGHERERQRERQRETERERVRDREREREGRIEIETKGNKSR